MINEVKITFNDGTVSVYPAGISYLELSKYYKNKIENPIIGVKVNNRVLNLTDKIHNDTVVKFFDFNDLNGYKMYQAGLKFVMLIAAKELWGNDSDVRFLNSLDKGIYTEIISNTLITEEEVLKLKLKMQEIINLDLVFEKNAFNKKEVISYYNQIHEEEKAANVSRIPNNIVTLYKLKNYYNYFYTDMPYSTGVLTKFDLSFINDNHIILRFPSPTSDNIVPEYRPLDKIMQVFEEYRTWLLLVNMHYVSDLNDLVINNTIKEFVMQNKIITDEYLIDIVKQIVNSDRNIKLISIAGPSSSGKTTSAHRISLYLKTFGINSYIMSADNYYKERLDIPKDEDGEYELDKLEALDIDMLNNDLNKLINYEEVIMPEYNFFTGKKEIKGRRVKLKEGDVVILEGLHCLNDELSKDISLENKFKIYISPFSGLCIDRHNHLSNVDVRLIRRIVRDNVFRGASVSDTIRIWQKVRRDEEKYIFPYQNRADAILNTSLIYELGVLKIYAEPILYSVPITSVYYEEARRLLGFLRTFFTISPELVDSDSVLREFIGGSIFS